ncbi:MAG: dTDP-glucose 4,6-dehydratase [Paraclostridium bifermentans]|uniref:dTDP-glucose 4,6-dehydratase n=1 Tax=Paraclostridium bifermentans TaxID=1490 RepID=UPI001DBC2889|nr:dTDP-glucose 4,6-dehydratase [Paraclostridium bifermentans]MBS6509105.1 dTDP-glucose 4,6-dehydratase [Paraclostridium bifermentans]
MKKILITGGAGFIGANLVKYMIDKYKNYKVVNLDLLTYAANLNNLKDIERNSNYKFIKGDIANREFIFKLFKDEKFDIVINCAAESHVDRSITEPGIFIKSNVVGTQVLLDACREYSVGRFHQVSTDEVYGDLPIDNPNLLFKEDGIIRPSSPYSASKASADLLVNSYYRTYNTPITISRCSNNYGPFQHNEKLIPLMISKILKNEKLPVYGDGRNIRDWLHVYDHCSAIDLIVHKGKEGEVYNIGGNCELSNIEIVKFLLENLNRSEDLITFVKDRPGHDLRYAVDSSKIERELGWDRKYNFSYGIIETINWYKENL